MPAVIQTSKDRKHVAKDIGAMPLINRYIERLRLAKFIEKHVPIWDLSFTHKWGEFASIERQQMQGWTQT
jgi:hypothetical protein